MKISLSIAFIFIAAIFAIAISVPALPVSRFTFKEIDPNSSYANYKYATMIYDNWTGRVQYAAEGRFVEDGDEKKAKFDSQGRILSLGDSLSEVYMVRYVSFSFITLLVFAGIFFIFRANRERTTM